MTHPTPATHPTGSSPLTVGCYTAPEGTGTGISGVRLSAAGQLTDEPLRDADGVRSPSFVALHPALPLVYAVEELDAGMLVTLVRSTDGSLTRLDERTTGGSSPCHVAVSSDTSGDLWLAVANYGDGSLMVVALADDGLPTGDSQVLRHAGSGPHAERQTSPHCHQVVFDGDLLMVTDLGTDRVHRYVREGRIWVPALVGPAELRAGSGPRHMVADGTSRYVVGELDSSVTCYRVDSLGAWVEVSRVTTTANPAGCQPSHLVMHEGRLIVANRGPDTLAFLTVDEGVLALVAEVPTEGHWPRHFAVVGETIVVANERSHALTAFAFAPETGLPVHVASLASGTPTCVVV